MKKVILLLLLFALMSLLVAQDRPTAEIKYWNTITHFTRLPWTFVQDTVTYTYSVMGVVYNPVAPVSPLNGIYVTMYQAGQLGDLNILGEIWAVNQDTGLPTGMFPLASILIPFAEIVWWGVGDTYFDFSAANLSFDAGEKFCFALSAPGASMGNTYTTPLLDAGVFGNSYRYFTQGLTGWQLYNGEFCFTASVEYDADITDVGAHSLWFTGDFFLEPGVTIAYEADVANYGQVAHTNVPVYLEVFDLAAPATPIWSDMVLVDLAIGETLHIDTFDPYTYPLTQGEFAVVLRTDLPGDMDPTNDKIMLEQQTVILPDLFDYDDGVGETAHAFYDAGSGWANSFWYYAEPMQVTEISFMIRDAGWPAGVVGNEFMQAKIYADDGFGAPGAVLFDSGVIGCTLGAWNTVDVSAANINIAADEVFYVAYHQVGDYPNCPGLLGDGSPPFASWATSWVYYYDGDLLQWVWETPNAYDEDMMIRAYGIPILSIEAPEVTVAIVGGDTVLDWNDVTGALSYNVYASDEPIAGWEFIETVLVSTVTYPGTDPRAFFRVTASTNADGTKSLVKPLVSTEIPASPNRVIRLHEDFKISE